MCKAREICGVALCITTHIWGISGALYLGPADNVRNTTQDFEIKIFWKIQSTDLWRIAVFLIATTLFIHGNIVTRHNSWPKCFIFGFKVGRFNMGFNGATKLHHGPLRENVSQIRILPYFAICVFCLNVIVLFWVENGCCWTLYCLCSHFMQKQA